MLGTIFSIAVKTAYNALQEDQELKDQIIGNFKNIVSDNIKKFSKFVDGNGNVDVEEEWAFAIRWVLNLVSVYGHSAQANSSTSEIEEEFIGTIVESFLLSEDNAILTPEMLEHASLKRKDVKKMLYESFANPVPLTDIAKYAIELESEDYFYQAACEMACCDEVIDGDERSFLDCFAKLLEIDPIDQRRIEGKARAAASSMMAR